MLYNELPSSEFLNSIFEYDPLSGKLFWKKRVANCIQVGQEAGYQANKYRQVFIKGTAYYVHRVIWKLMTGELSCAKQIDHRDRVHINNKWNNLRLVTQSVNRQNQGISKNNTSGVVGVSFHVSGLYVGSITVDKKRETTYHSTFEKAARWRRKKEKEYNFITNF